MDLILDRLTKGVPTKNEERRLRFPNDEKLSVPTKVCINDLLLKGKLSSAINLATKGRAQPKRTKQSKNVGTNKKAKPHQITSTALEANRDVIGNGEIESPRVQNKKKSVSPKRHITQEAKSASPRSMGSKAISKQNVKKFTEAPTIIIAEASRPSSKSPNDKHNYEKAARSDHQETVLLSEKLASFNKQNLSSNRPKFNFGKSKQSVSYDLNFECLFVLGKKISRIYELLSKNSSICLPCKEYLQVSKARNRENFEKLFKDEVLRATLKEYFILEKVSIVTIFYCFSEEKADDQLILTFKSLLQLIYQDMIIFLQSLYCRLDSEPIIKNWRENLMNILTKEFHSEQEIFEKRTEYLQRMKYNNFLIQGTVKKICSGYISNKELHYCINMILLQLEKLSVEDADKKILDSLSLYLSERELRSQDPFRQPKSPAKIVSKAKESMKESPLKELIEPYLPSQLKYPYTLVVDLDETLVHYAEVPGQMNELRVRPYAEYFLNEMAQYYEIVVFTAAMKDYADWAINTIDKNNNISYRLYRHHASFDAYGYAKDLSKIGRDLSKVIIVDNVAENFKLQPDNGIFIKTWYEDPEDTALLELTPLLKEIAVRKVKDVRRALKAFREQMMMNIEKGIDDPHLYLKLDPEELEGESK